LEIKLAKSAGFCFGVKRAVDKVYEQVEDSRKKQIYTFGPIINNEEVVKTLTGHGVKVLYTEEDVKNIDQGVVVIRSHGVSRHIYEILKQKEEIEVIDATCPFVKKIHKIVEKQTGLGRKVIIIGNEKHPEVLGIKGWGNSQTIVIESESQIEQLERLKNEKLCVVAQTTFNYIKFKDLVEKISKRGYDVYVLNTICNATQERQIEAKQIAGEVETMIVIGDQKSSNTQKLYEICRNECENTYYIQTLKDLKLDWVSSARSIGITAGASTPNNIIEEVHTNVRIKF